MPKYINYRNQKYEVYEAEKRPSVWSRFKAGAKDIADKTLKAPQKQSQQEIYVESENKSIPISEYERQIYETERRKVLISEARKRALTNAHRPPQPKQEGFWKRMVSETPEQKAKAQAYLQGKSILQHMVNPSKNRQLPQYVDIDKLVRSGMRMTGLGSGNQMTFGRPQQPMVQRIKARRITKYVKTKIKGRTAYRKITKLIRSKARPIQVQQQPQSTANIDAMLRRQMGLNNPHPIIHSKKQKGDAVSQINKIMGL